MHAERLAAVVYGVGCTLPLFILLCRLHDKKVTGNLN